MVATGRGLVGRVAVIARPLVLTYRVLSNVAGARVRVDSQAEQQLIRGAVLRPICGRFGGDSRPIR